MSQSKPLAINETYDLLNQAYTSIFGMNGFNGVFYEMDDDFKRRVDDANGPGASDDFERSVLYYRTGGLPWADLPYDEGPALVCGYVGESIPVSPNHGGNIINTTGVKCLEAGKDDFVDNYRIVRSYTWDQGACALVDDVTGEHSNMLRRRVLPSGIRLTDSRFPRNLMKHCPASVQVIDNYNPPDLIDLSDQRNYNSDIHVHQKASGRGSSQIRYNDETYTCIPSTMWNRDARNTQLVVDAEELTCCKGESFYEDNGFGSACQGELRLKLVNGVYQPQP